MNTFSSWVTLLTLCPSPSRVEDTSNLENTLVENVRLIGVTRLGNLT